MEKLSAVLNLDWLILRTRKCHLLRLIDKASTWAQLAEYFGGIPKRVEIALRKIRIPLEIDCWCNS